MTKYLNNYRDRPAPISLEICKKALLVDFMSNALSFLIELKVHFPNISGKK